MSAKKIRATLAFFVLSISSLPVVAADEQPGWDFSLTPYLFAVSMDGKTYAGDGPPADVDISFSDILSNLNFAFALHTEFSNGNWTFAIDPFYSSLTVEDGTHLPDNPDIDIDTWIVDLWVAYEVVPSLKAMAGFRWQSQDNELKTADPLNFVDENWTDFFIGTRYTKTFAEKWLFTARGDITVAGDSDSGWNVVLLFNRGFRDTQYLNLGWRWFDDDYDNGTFGSDDYYRWNVLQSGPVIGYTWTF